MRRRVAAKSELGKRRLLSKCELGKGRSKCNLSTLYLSAGESLAAGGGGAGKAPCRATRLQKLGGRQATRAENEEAKSGNLERGDSFPSVTCPRCISVPASHWLPAEGALERHRAALPACKNLGAGEPPGLRTRRRKVEIWKEATPFQV
jgi:hypothetical protein